MKIPDKLGKYEIESVLGSGAMGIVYKARDPDIGETVAIKMIRRELLANDESGAILQRFRNEVVVCRRLKHPNIVATYEYQEDDERCFIAMEYVEGKQLKDLMDEHIDFSYDQILPIMEQMLSALNYAHERGIVHRDIKPANIMVKKSLKILIADFGIAKIDTSELTIAGTIMGSPGYMSPEQCLGKTVDARSDIFSAGVILYQLLTGEKPFAGDTPMSTMSQVLNLAPVKPSQLNNSISKAIDAVIEKAMAKKPDDRFQTADEFYQALEKAQGKKVAKKPSLSGESDDASPDGLKKYAKIIATLTVVGLMSGGGFFYLNSPEMAEDTKVASVEPVKGIPIEAAPIETVPPDVPGETPSTETVIAKLDTILAELSCANVVASTDSNQKLVIKGHVRPEDLEPLESQLGQLAKNVEYELLVEPLAWPYCEIESIVAASERHNIKAGLGLQIEPSQHSDQFIEGEYLVFEIITPPFESYLYVDYYQSDGVVIHLLPNETDLNNQVQANQRLIFGEADDGTKQWAVYPPFGKELITIIASAEPLLESARQEIDKADDYLPLVRESISQLKQDSLVADHVYITTRAAD